MLDFKQQTMRINNPMYKSVDNGGNSIIHINQMSVQDEKEEEEINFTKAVENLTTISKEVKKQLIDILIKN